MRGAPRAGPPLVALALLAAAGCGDERFVGGLHAFAMTPDTPHAIETASGREAWHLVTQEVRFPLRGPSSATRDALGDQPPDYPFGRLPWVREDDVAVEIDWVLHHVAPPGAPDAVATVVVDGVSELHRYLPGFAVDGEAVTPFRSGWERTVTLAPGARIGDTVVEPETREIARDLATLAAGGALDPDAVVDPASDSRRDPAARARVPTPAPGLVGVRLGIRAEVAAPLVLEATVRVRDRGDRLAGRGDAVWDLRPRPRAFGGLDVVAGEGAP